MIRIDSTINSVSRYRQRGVAMPIVVIGLVAMLAIAGLAATSVYSGVLTNGMAIMGSGATKFTALIWVIALFLYFYARAMAERKVLR